MRERGSRRALAPDLLLLLVAMAWGGSYLSAKNLVAAVDVDVALALRYGVAALGMSVFLAIRRRVRLDRRSLLIGLGLGLSQAAVLWLETAGVGLTSSTNAGLLISLSLIFTPLLEALVLQRRLPPRFYLLAVAAIFGSVLLASPDGLQAPGPGDLLILTAAAVRAVHVTATARLLRPADDVPLLVALQVVAGAAIFIVASGSRLPAAIASMGVASWGDAIFLGLACSVFAFLVQAWAIRRSSAARASLLMGIEPVWAIIIGAALGGDRLGPGQLLGAVLVVASTTLGARVERRAREARELRIEVSMPPSGREPTAPRSSYR